MAVYFHHKSSLCIDWPGVMTLPGAAPSTKLLFDPYVYHVLWLSQWERASFTVRITWAFAKHLAGLLTRKTMDSPILVMLGCLFIWHTLVVSETCIYGFSHNYLLRIVSQNVAKYGISHLQLTLNGPNINGLTVFAKQLTLA